MASRAISKETWEHHRAMIYELYINQDLKLDRVNKEMRERGFIASNQQYARRFKEWKMIKSLKEDEWKYISHRIQSRSLQGKPSVVFVHNQLIPERKYSRGVQRHDRPSFTPSNPLPQSMDYIRVCTPAVSSGNELVVQAAQSVQQELRTVVVVLENLPSWEISDLLDQNREAPVSFIFPARSLTVEVRVYEDSLSRQAFSSSISTTTFRQDVQVVLQYCNASLRLLGFAPENSSLALEESPESTLWKQICCQYRLVQDPPTDCGLSTFLQLLKIILSLTANNLLVSSYDKEFQDLVDLLQKVDPIDHFLQLIANYGLHWILRMMMRLRHSTLEIFMNRIVIHSAAQGDCKLVRSVLETGLATDALEAKEWITEAFRNAVSHGQSLGLTRYLLDVGANPYVCDEDRLCELLQNAWIESDSALIQSLLDAMVLKYESKYWNIWQELICHAFEEATHLRDMVLNSFVELIPPTFRSDCRLLIAATFNSERQALNNLLWEQRWKEKFLSEPRCQIIFGCLCETTASKADIERLEYLKNINPVHFQHSLSEILDAFPIHNEDTFLSLLLRLDYFFDLNQSGSIFKAAIERRWTKIAKFILQNAVKAGHQPISYFVDFDLEYRNASFSEILHDEVVLDWILSNIGAEGTHSIFRWLEWAILANELWLLKRIIHLNTIRASVEEIFGMPKFLSYALTEGNAETIQWLLALKSFLDPLNKTLDCDLTEDFWRPLGGGSGFRYPPSILTKFFSAGLSSSRDLLVMICSTCSEYRMENMRAIIDWRSSQGQPFSKADMSYCLDQIIDLRDHRLTRNSCWSCWRTSPNDGIPCHLRVLRLLRDYGATAKQLWVQAVLESNIEDSNMLVRRFFDAGMNAIHTAVLCLDITVLESLLTLGYSPNGYYRELGGCYETPIQVAASAGRHDVIEMLLRRGANVNALPYDHHGRTALQAAAAYGDLQLAVDLLRAGADIDAPAARLSGITALEGAASRGHLDLVHILITNSKNLFWLRKDCKRASRQANAYGHRVISRMLDKHARELAHRLGVEHEDEIDEMCNCEIFRSGHCRCGLERVFHVEMCEDCVMELCDEFKKCHSEQFTQ